MKLLLDTTYLLPAIGISIKNLPKNILTELLRRKHEIVISEIELFELAAKGAKYVSLGKLSINRVLLGVRALVYDERIGKIPVYNDKVLSQAIKLRKILGDFIDCIILSTALNYADALITEDEDIFEAVRTKDYEEVFRKVNPKFTVMRFKEILSF